VTEKDKEYLEYRVDRKASTVLAKVINELITESTGDMRRAVIALWCAAAEVLNEMPVEEAIDLRQEAIMQNRQDNLFDLAYVHGYDGVDFSSLLDAVERSKMPQELRLRE
jgi:hypothetical protein